MSYLRRATCLSILALMPATAVRADVAAGRSPPSFTAEELKIIGRDKRLIYAAKSCAWQLRQAFEALEEMRRGSRVGREPEPCRPISDDPGRASDEGALDILKILREAAGQDTNR